ncbi:MAG: DNA translocase FtsK [Bacteroidota bacterium]
MTSGKRKKKKNTKQKSLPFFGKGVQDERYPKIFGVLLLLFAFYFFIAFTSYLFTWRVDQNEVLNSSTFEILFGAEVKVENWLGRLGALVSHLFFYHLFGLPSYLVVLLCFLTGVSLVKRQPLKQHRKFFINSVMIMIWVSTLLAFLLVSPGLIVMSGFSWGGAIGELISLKLSAIFGSIGMILFLLFSVGILGIWVFNPNFNDVNYERFVYRFRKLTGINLKFGSNASKEDEPETTETTAKPKETRTEPKVLQPKYLEAKNEEPNVNPLNKPDIIEAPKPIVKDPVKESQLSFEISEEKQRQKKESLQIGDSSLEINNLSESEEKKPEEGQIPDRITQGNIDHMEPYDPTLELPSYDLPVLPLLKDYSEHNTEIDRSELEANKDQIIETLLNYKIEITKIKATIGPTVTLYEIVPAAGVRISKIKNLEDDIALSLAALGIRIIAPIPGRGTIGIEVPNKNKQIVSLKEVLASEKYKRAKMDLPIALGKTISNEVFVADLGKMPHLLVAGATGQGKSVGINTILMSLLYKKHPSQIKLVLIDPKKVELSLYNRIDKHFLAYLPGEEEGIITDTNKVVATLNSLCIEMDQRYDLLKKASVRNLKEYNKKFVDRKLNPEKGHRFLPYIVLVIDEFADMIMTAGKEVELPIGRLAQLARAVGIHLIIATQRPSVNIITGVIKANFPARIAFKVTSKIDSRTILDGGGAEQLIGRGDMLLSVDGKIIRLQCAFVDTPEVEDVINFISEQKGYPEPFFLPEYGVSDESGSNQVKFEDFDDLFEDAARTIVQNQIGSTSMLQRRLKLGYNRAGRIMDQMESVGIVGPSEGSKAREVLIYDEIELERYLEQLKKG